MQTEYRTHSPRPRGARERSYNIGDWERLGSLALGAVLTLRGLRRPSLPGLLTAGTGALLLARGVTGHSRAYARLGIQRPDAPVEMRTSLTIARGAEEVYGFWRELSNLPRFMSHLHAVTVRDATHSHWVARPPFGAPAPEWDAQIIEDRPSELIRWRSLPGADVANEGSVTFRPAPAGRGTEVHVTLAYRPPVGTALATLMAPVSTQVLKEEIRGLKQLLETGEIATTDNQPSARRRRAA